MSEPSGDEARRVAWDVAALDAAGAALAGRVGPEPELVESAEPAEPEEHAAAGVPAQGTPDLILPGSTDNSGAAENVEPDNSGAGEPTEPAEPREAVEPAEAESGEATEPAEAEPAEPEPAEAGETALAEALEAADLAAATPEEIEDSGLPDLTDDRELDGAMESVLLVVDSPVNEDQLATALAQPITRVKEALSRISSRYTESGSGIDLRRVGDGWRFYTRDRYAPFVEKLLLDGQRAKLTRAALETLAVIAYRQPVTRARVAAVRGVNVDGVIRTLVARGLIEEVGTDGDTGGILYRTTELFLERLGLPSLADLPPIAPLLPEVDAIDDV